MGEYSAYVGLDLHKETIAVAVACVNGGGIMYRCGGAKMMEWTPPLDGIALYQGGGVY